MTGTEQMYHQQQQQLQHLSSRPSIPPEKHYLQQGGDSGLVLSTDAKPRLKWTPELHERFLEAVNQLGGPDKATPKTIMRFMGIPGLTLYHLKSHLQKYRLSKSLQAQANAVHAKNGCRTAADKPYEGNGPPASHLNLEPQINRSMHISEALRMQIEVQRRLHEQLEVQRHLQLRIEAQGKYLQSVLEKAQEALAKQSVDVDGDVLGLHAAAASPNTRRRRVSELTDTATAEGVHHHRRRQLGAGDGSVDSCLTACERGSLQSQRDHDMLSIGLFPPFAEAATSCEEEYLFLGEPSRARAASSDEHRAIRRDRFHHRTAPFREAELDLNINGANTSRHRSCDKIDLNGSSWN